MVHVTTTDMSLALLLGPQLGAYNEAGFDVIGVSAPGEYVAQLARWGVRHVPLRHATRAQAPHRDVAAFVELRSVLQELRPEIVHTHNPKPGIYGRLAARSTRVPAVVNTVHGLYALPGDPWPKRGVVYGLERLAASCSHAELVQNPEDVEVLARIGVPREKLWRLGNGIDLERFNRGRVSAEQVDAARAAMGARPDEVVCGVVGRLVWEKGYREVFEAAARLRDRLPKLKIVVVGPLDLDKSDAVTSTDLGEAERRGGVRFLGLRHDVETLYAAMDLYALASHREGFPRSAMEAAAMGLPIVATDIRGCRQVVDHGITGLLVPPRDAQALVDTIVRVATDEDLRARMSVAAREKACREFDQRRVIATTLQVYDHVLSGSARGQEAMS